MRRLARATARSIAIGTAALAFPLAFATSGVQAGAPAPSAASDAATLARGAYLARAADCIACHTTDASRPFAGGVPLHTPFGTLYSPNITPDRDTGIGRYSDADFLSALHDGIRRDGAHLYPAFPYTAYTQLSDADVLAIKAYLFTQQPIRATPPPNALHFPFNLRWGLALWNAFNFHPGRYRPQPARGDLWNRGAYLVQGLGHCAECHTPRNWMQGLDTRHAWAGGTIDRWQAPALAAAADTNADTAPRPGLDGWRTNDLVAYLRTGRAPGHGNASGPMAQVVQDSTQYLRLGDLQAIAVYLKALPPQSSGGDALPPASAPAARGELDALRGIDDRGTWSGERLYLGHCASCHGADGRGAGLKPGPTGEAPMPPLWPEGRRAGAVADNLVLTILQGVHRRTRDNNAFMPGFAHVLDDAALARVASYVAQRFGSGQTVAPADVARLRSP